MGQGPRTGNRMARPTRGHACNARAMALSHAARVAASRSSIGDGGTSCAAGMIAWIAARSVQTPAERTREKTRAHRRGFGGVAHRERALQMIGHDLHEEGFWLGPPSAKRRPRRAASGPMARNTSATCSAMLSPAARATCAGPAPKDRPEISPRAAVLQCGAPKPTWAGTSDTPQAVGHRARQIHQRVDPGQAQKLAVQGRIAALTRILPSKA